MIIILSLHLFQQHMMLRLTWHEIVL